jgi:hypothetical protein
MTPVGASRDYNQTMPRPEQPRTIHLLRSSTPHTTARYFEAALGRSGARFEVYRDGAFDPRGAGPADLVVYVDPSSDWPLGFETLPCATAGYFIDVHQDLRSRLLLANFFDAVFVAQRDYVTQFRDAGHAHVGWLPLACDPGTSALPAVPRDLEMAFVGKLGSRGSARHANLTGVLPHFRTNDYARFYNPEEMAAVYARAKIVLNASINGDVNMRLFEGMAAGALLLTDRIGNGLDELFTEGVDYVGYSDADEAVRQARKYLEDDAARERIARSGCRKALELHSYDARLRDLIAASEGVTGSRRAASLSRRQLAEVYAGIFVAMRRPARLFAVAAAYGVSVPVLRGMAMAWGRWINARIPVTPNAIRARLAAR